jgi:hypothetical protein
MKNQKLVFSEELQTSDVKLIINKNQMFKFSGSNHKIIKRHKEERN